MKGKPEKKPRLFYYEEAINAWTPCPEKVDCMVSTDEFDSEEDTREISFKTFWMTDEEYENIPEE